MISKQLNELSYQVNNMYFLLHYYLATVQSNYNFTLPRVITFVNVCNTQRAPMCHSVILHGIRSA